MCFLDALFLEESKKVEVSHGIHAADLRVERGVCGQTGAVYERASVVFSTWNELFLMCNKKASQIIKEIRGVKRFFLMRKLISYWILPFNSLFYGVVML